MHDIEPFHNWRDLYIASEDERSPFYGRMYDEFKYTKKIYNYFIHPQWDEIGSPTLYIKILYVDYDIGFGIIELIGEWNDCLNNDIMYLKREIVDNLINQGVVKFMLLCDHVLNFHADDDCYYEEWWDDIKDDNGWIYFINTREHVRAEMNLVQIKNYVTMMDELVDVNWRKQNPLYLFSYLDNHAA